MSNVNFVTSLSEFQELIQTENLTITNFHADWCGPCKAIAPIFERLSEEFTEVQFLKVDSDDSEDITQEYHLTSVPAFILFKNGEKISFLGGANPPAMRKLIEEHQ
ncbi:Thioredoxin M-type [Wickerhamomyces ciferrii]|uniref:Thioredoxin n=1 Tax=Wickerhamomyces ciferrii (strain ATCC 14091 / BCRC 22168 / CBS 111 / JCM 3599 / NBRC 0793 / NRRL Y-1031 F-60-10) TaxID=1206466 RepID=K0KJQ2_WICCF|nr:Thioredoxin M-type [Wickerhamomyces ciferrii]CCH42367.1 Thioredoxin M-type [Wickerhamomyces ciferrii]